MIPVNEIFEEIMKPRKTTTGIIINGVVTRIVLAIVLAFFATFLHDYLDGVNAFGDYISDKDLGSGPFSEKVNAGEEAWGTRHYWYVWGCIVLFLGWIAKVINYLVIKSAEL